MIAVFGGLSTGVFTVIGFICTEITHRMIVAKFIKKFYANQHGIYMLKSE